MKKMKICLVGILTLMLSLFCFVACGVTGTYKFSYMEIAGVKYEAGSEIPMVGSFDEDSYVVTLESDGTAIVSTNMMGATQEVEGTWEEVDGKVVIDMQGMKSEVEIDGGEMIIDAEGMGKIVLSK